MSQIKVKHFGVILLHYITFCAALYFTTCKGHLSSLIYHVWQHGIGFFFSNNACLRLNKHRSPADLGLLAKISQEAPPRFFSLGGQTEAICRLPR